MAPTNQAADDFDAVVSEVMGSGTDMEMGVDVAAGADETVIQVIDSEGVTHTLRNPELCLVYHPATRLMAFERGPIVEEQSKLGTVEAPAGAEDVERAIATIVALTLAQKATQHNRQIIRVARTGNGPAVAAALREAGFYVIEFGE